jgi:hypothetical protein
MTGRRCCAAWALTAVDHAQDRPAGHRNVLALPVTTPVILRARCRSAVVAGFLVAEPHG